MLVFYVLLGSWIFFRTVAASQFEQFDDSIESLRWALAVMFFFTASAHWGKRRPDLIRMVPYQKAGTLVTLTGIFEILGAIGLLLPSTTRVAAWCLAFLLVPMFRANIRAARRKLSIGGRPVMPVPQRAALQVVFIAALLATALL